MICSVATWPGARSVLPVTVTAVSCAGAVLGAVKVPFCELTRPTDALPPGMPFTEKFMNVPWPLSWPTSHSFSPALTRVAVAWMLTVCALAGSEVATMTAAVSSRYEKTSMRSPAVS